MKRQRLLALSCAIAMAFSMVACSGTSTASQNGSTPAAANSSSAEKASSSSYVPKGNFNIRVFAGAGGIADTITRLAAQGLQTKYGATAMVNNLAGANGAVAATDMNRYQPSINELSVVSMSLFTMTPLLSPNLKVKLDDYQIVSSLIKDEFVLVTSAKGNIKSWDDLVKYAGKNQIIFGSNSSGGNTHVLQTALFGEAGIKAQALTSDSSTKDILAVLSHNAVCACATASLAKTYVDSGDVIPIAVFSDKPYTGYKNIKVPSIKDLGYDITMPSYNFIITRAGVDPAEVKGLHDAIVAYRDTDEFKQAAAKAAYTPDDTSPEELRSEIEHYADFCKNIYSKYYKK